MVKFILSLYIGDTKIKLQKIFHNEAYTYNKSQKL